MSGRPRPCAFLVTQKEYVSRRYREVRKDTIDHIGSCYRFETMIAQRPTMADQEVVTDQVRELALDGTYLFSEDTQRPRHYRKSKPALQ